jgi:hypothetical protein
MAMPQLENQQWVVGDHFLQDNYNDLNWRAWKSLIWKEGKHPMKARNLLSLQHGLQFCN